MVIKIRSGRVKTSRRSPGGHFHGVETVVRAELFHAPVKGSCPRGGGEFRGEGWRFLTRNRAKDSGTGRLELKIVTAPRGWAVEAVPIILNYISGDVRVALPAGRDSAGGGARAPGFPREACTALLTFALEAATPRRGRERAAVTRARRSRRRGSKE